MGYLNLNFEFGITLLLNRTLSLKKGFEKIEDELKSLIGEFKPISIKRIGEKDTLMIISQHKVPETGNVMKVYHLIFQLNDKERKEVAALARKNKNNGSRNERNIDYRIIVWVGILGLRKNRLLSIIRENRKFVFELCKS